MPDVSMNDLRDLYQAGRIRMGSPRRESLTDSQQTLARQIHSVCRPYWGNQSVYEQFEFNLLLDSDPDKELALWQKIVDALQHLRERWPSRSRAERERHYQCLIGISFDGYLPNGASRADRELFEYLSTLIPKEFRRPLNIHRAS